MYKTNRARFCFSHRGPHLWNKIVFDMSFKPRFFLNLQTSCEKIFFKIWRVVPTQFQELTSLQEFKMKIRKWITKSMFLPTIQTLSVKLWLCANYLACFYFITIYLKKKEFIFFSIVHLRKPRRVNLKIFFKSENIFQIQKYISNPETYFIQIQKYISNPEILFQIQIYISFFESRNIIYFKYQKSFLQPNFVSFSLITWYTV